MTENAAELTIEGDRNDVRSARRFVDDTLTEWGLDEVAIEVTLVASELVTNAVLHARTAITIRLRHRDDRLRLEVRDGSPALPQPRFYTDLSATGRGLHLVESVAEVWGAEPFDGGKTVWCELVVPEARTA